MIGVHRNTLLVTLFFANVRSITLSRHQNLAESPHDPVITPSGAENNFGLLQIASRIIVIFTESMLWHKHC